MSPLVINDIMRLSNEGPGKMTMPCEIWQSPDNKTTLLVMRTGTESGKARHFADELVNFTVAQGFSNVVVLTSTISPVKRGRDTNGDIPELYAYINNF